MAIVIGLCALVVGYLVYGKFVEKIFGIDDRQTAALAINDGVDCVPMPIWKTFLIQLLNIAGLGPIFGALAGAVFGPIVLLWVVFGCVLGGAVHDYFAAMISSRHGGCTLGELMGIYLGPKVRTLLQFCTMLMMIMVGTVFTSGSVNLLAKVTPDFLNVPFWTVVVVIYFFLSTFLPIDKVIGKIYPLFGLVLLIMAVGILYGVVASGGFEFSLANLHPKNTPAWPFMFVAVACGAISGFHATQSPMMAKCIRSEREGRITFYGAMIAEGIIALAWAGAGLVFYKSTGDLNAALGSITASGVVYNISVDVLGTAGGLLAVVGVAICPITSGDTALRAARLIAAECLHLEQKSVKNRLLLTVPIFACCVGLMFVNFNVLWRYFAWANQTLAMFTLLMCTSYLVKNGKGYKSAVTALPAAFMVAVSTTYILMAPEGLALTSSIAYPVGAAGSLLTLVWWVRMLKNCPAKETK